VQEARFRELRAAMNMARREHGKRRQVDRILSVVYRQHSEAFSKLDLEDAKTVLNELAS